MQNANENTTQRADQTATKLWQQYGQSMPMSQWINNEIVKAKQAKVYREGMSFQEIFDANRKPADAATGTPAPNAAPDTKGGSKFTIGGYNGYVVLGVSAAVAAGLIYLGVRIYKARKAKGAASAA